MSKINLLHFENRTVQIVKTFSYDSRIKILTATNIEGQPTFHKL